jgi:serine protease Do
MYSKNHYGNHNFGNANEHFTTDYMDQIYTINAGDTLYRIAARYNITINQILQANPGLDPYRLYIGQQIHIPVFGPIKCSSPITQVAKKVIPAIVDIILYELKQDTQLLEAISGGSGVIIRENGYIVTNYHVMKIADPKNNANKTIITRVTLFGKRQVPAKFIGGDDVTDLAVIKIDLGNLAVAELGDSSRLEVGELALAFGFPGKVDALECTVTAGIISGLNRAGIEEYATKRTDYIQTDAPINYGNSGGALVNCKGQVIGINAWGIPKVSIEELKGYEGLNFAIPINRVKEIVEHLIKFGAVKGRLMIGIEKLVTITEFQSRITNLPMGLLVTDLWPEGDAAKAGVQKDDIITSMAGKPIGSMRDLDEIEKDYRLGDTVKMVIFRTKDNKFYNLMITFTKEF